MRFPLFSPGLPLPRVSHFGISLKGKVRERNEDRLTGVFPRSPYLLYRKGPLFVVTDGVGGHKCGAFASSIAIRSIKEAYYKGPAQEQPADALERAFQWASATIFYAREEKKECAGMACTAVGMTLVRNSAYIAWVGDSRAYLFRKGFLTPLTTDHRVLQGEKKVLERALGVCREVEVDVVRLTVQPLDRILLCTDGLTEEVPDEHLEEILRQSPDIRKNARALAHLANVRGGHDNITILIARILSLPGR